MESRIIYHIEKFIFHLLGKDNENDREQRIYNKLLRLEGDKLENWMNERLKKYIFAKKYDFTFMGDMFEGIISPSIFKNWYYFYIQDNSQQLMTFKEIFGEEVSFNEEYHIIKNKIQTFQMEQIEYRGILNWEMAIMNDYLEMYIMTKSSDELKSYIIQIVEPIVIK